MAVPKRFGVLRFVGTLLKILAWIIFVGTVLVALSAIASTFLPTFRPPFIDPLIQGLGLEEMPANMSGWVAGLITFLAGLLAWLLITLAGDNLFLRIATEENTRLTAALLLRMHQDSQVEADAAYGTSYTGETYGR